MHRIASVLPLLLAPLALVLVSATSPSARAWYIKPDGSGDAPTIQAGVDSAAVGDTVLVACGTYFERGIDITRGLTLAGETGVPADVVIDSPSEGWILHGDHTRHRTVVSGLTLKNAVSHGAVSLYNSYTFRFEHCIFRENSGVSGGGIRACLTNLNLHECLFERNFAAEGGAVDIYDGWGFITDCTFVDNTATMNGAAIWVKWCSSADVRRCVFLGNVGGDLRAEWSSRLETTQCTFVRNCGGFSVAQNSSISFSKSIVAFIPEGFSTGWCAGGCSAELHCCNVFGMQGATGLAVSPVSRESTGTSVQIPSSATVPNTTLLSPPTPPVSPATTRAAGTVG
jgi:hypothetical protein